MKDKNHAILAVVFSTMGMIYYACEYRNTNERYYLFALGFCVALVLFTLRNYREVYKIEKAYKAKNIKTQKYKTPRIKKHKRLIWGKKKKPEVVQYSKYHEQYEAIWEELNK